MQKQLVNLATKLGESLLAHKKCIAVAESCTGGLVAAAITEIAGSSAWFERAFITYSNPAKEEMLGIPRELIEEAGAVSHRVVEAMVKGALQNSRADFAAAVSGVAGPGGGSTEKPVGTVYIGWGDRQHVTVVHHLFTGDRQSVRNQSAICVLDSLISLSMESA